MELSKQLASEQESLGQMISKLLENMKKDGPHRKTQQYVNDKRRGLETYWQEFKERHHELEELGASDHSYFTKGFFAQVEEAYNQAKALLKTYQKALDDKGVQAVSSKMLADEIKGGTKTSTATKRYTDDKGESVAAKTSNAVAVGNHLNYRETDDQDNDLRLNSGEIDEQNLRIKRQQLKMGSLRRILEDINKRQSNQLPKSYYDYKKWTLQEQFNRITELHEEIILNEKLFVNNYFLENEYEDLEELFQKGMISIHQQTEGVTAQPRDDALRCLPRISIPLFEGNYNMWTTFRDIFKRLIHDNVQLSNAEKMHYLKTSLKGEAEKLIRHLEISDSNYITGWNLLNDRYNNQRLLLFNQLETLLNIPANTAESTANLKQLHDTTRECLHAINNLEISTSNWGPIIVFHLLKKLDKETRKWYEQSLSEPRSVPDLDEFLRFIEIRFQSLENIKEQRRYPDTVKAQTSKYELKAFHTISAECKYCKSNHSIYSCKQFQGLSTSDRKKFVIQGKLCNNCLNHDVKVKCNSTRRCGICKRFHHTLLHEKPVASHTTLTEQAQAITRPETTSSYNIKATKNVLLATALVRARGIAGNHELLRALVDPGSQASFITENAAQTLGLPRIKALTEVTGVGTTDSGASKSKVQVILSPRFSSNFSIQIEALVFPTLTKFLPSNHIQSSKN